jgi:hypothetical protein
VAPWSTWGTWFRSLDGLEETQSLPCLSGVLDVEASGSLGVANQVASTFPRRTLGVAPWLTRGTWFRSLDGLEGNAVAPLSVRSLNVEAWGSLGVELELGRSAWPVVDQGNAVAPLSTRSLESRPRDRSAWSWNSAARRGMWSTRGTWSLPCLSEVLDVKAWGSLDVELKLGRSMWCRG